VSEFLGVRLKLRAMEPLTVRVELTEGDNDLRAVEEPETLEDTDGDDVVVTDEQVEALTDGDAVVDGDADTDGDVVAVNVLLLDDECVAVPRELTDPVGLEERDVVPVRVARDAVADDELRAEVDASAEGDADEEATAEPENVLDAELDSE
jgi:hypothetical protein